MGEGVEKVPALLAGGGEDGAEDSEGLGSGFGPEATGDFLLHFHHADILLSLIVSERHGGMGQKTEHVRFVILQAQQQIMPRAATCAPASFAFPGPYQSPKRWLVFVECQPLHDDAVITCGQPPDEG